MEVSEFYNETIGVTLLRYKGEKGMISLCPPGFATLGKWEIYCLEGNLLEDVERYDSKEKAESRIRELLSE